MKEPKDPVERIRRFNLGRDPERLALKYAAMRRDAFAFLRGTCHLFYGDVAEAGVLRKAPRAWCCGDLHLENFGTYKGDNRLVYFDLNDFDEAALATATWDLVRLLASVLVFAGTRRIARPDAHGLCAALVEAYAEQLRGGSARWVERELASGMIRELMDGLSGRSRPAFLDRRTRAKSGRRKFVVDGRHFLEASADDRDRVRRFMAEFARTTDRPRFYRLLDVARRVAGTGSLGIERFALLVEGKGSPDRNYMLDLKLSPATSLGPALTVRQPKWTSDAHRIVAVQKRMQAVPMAFLAPVSVDDRAFVLRALQPVEDRVTLAAAGRGVRRLREVMQTMGRLLASAQLRSSGRDGSAIADELIEFGYAAKWRSSVLELARERATRAESDWKKFAAAYDGGAFS